MTDDEFEAMQAEYDLCGVDGRLRDFAEAVRAAERERCQALCRSMSFEFNAASKEQDALQRAATRMAMPEYGA